jgi:hypothetical protein
MRLSDQFAIDQRIDVSRADLRPLNPTREPQAAEPGHIAFLLLG